MRYIIELNPDCIDREFLRMPIRLAGEDQWIKTKASLTPYTEPDLEAIEDEVWSFAWKIFSMDIGEYAGIFDDKGCPSDYREAKAKYGKWLKQNDEIKVGDEVETESGNKACVLYENPDGTQTFVFKADGTAAWWSKCAIHKTGKNHPEVAELLEKMRETKEC